MKSYSETEEDKGANIVANTEAWDSVYNIEMVLRSMFIIYSKIIESTIDSSGMYVPLFQRLTR